jgi:hypothetical protein
VKQTQLTSGGIATLVDLLPLQMEDEDYSQLVSSTDCQSVITISDGHPLKHQFKSHRIAHDLLFRFVMAVIESRNANTGLRAVGTYRGSSSAEAVVFFIVYKCCFKWSNHRHGGRVT